MYWTKCHHCHSVLEIVTDEMLQDAMKYTKAKTQVKHSVCTSSHIEKYIYYDILLAELKAFIVLLYLLGISHCNGRNVKDL